MDVIEFGHETHFWNPQGPQSTAISLESVAHLILAKKSLKHSVKRESARLGEARLESCPSITTYKSSACFPNYSTYFVKHGYFFRNVELPLIGTWF